MNGSCSIRDVGMGDACALASLHEKSFFDHWSTETFQALLTRPYVKAYGGTVGTGFDLQGFVLIQIIADEAEILTFCVAPDVRRRRMGGALLSVAERGAALLGVSRSASAATSTCAILGRSRSPKLPSIRSPPEPATSKRLLARSRNIRFASPTLTRQGGNQHWPNSSTP